MSVERAYNRVLWLGIASSDCRPVRESMGRWPRATVHKVLELHFGPAQGCSVCSLSRCSTRAIVRDKKKTKKKNIIYKVSKKSRGTRIVIMINFSKMLKSYIYLIRYDENDLNIYKKLKLCFTLTN